MAEKGTVSKTKRRQSEKTNANGGRPKDGQQRKHNRKPSDAMKPENMAFHRPTGQAVGARQKVLRARYEQAQKSAAATEHAIVTAHTLLLADLEYMFKKYDWSNQECRSLANHYAFELFHGTGQKPFDLNSLAAVQVQKRFVRICMSVFVNSDTVPGQRQEWYREMTSEIEAKAQPKPGRTPTNHIQAMARIASVRESASV